MRTFFIQTLGCRVNHYESQQLAAFLRARGLVEASASRADLRIIHTCSVTSGAASKSRQSVRRMVRLTILDAGREDCHSQAVLPHTLSAQSASPEQRCEVGNESGTRPKVVVTGCWAQSDAEQAASLAGVDAVLGHQQDVAVELARLLDQWLGKDNSPNTVPSLGSSQRPEPAVLPDSSGDEGWTKNEKIPGKPASSSEARSSEIVKRKLENDEKKSATRRSEKREAGSEKEGTKARRHEGTEGHAINSSLGTQHSALPKSAMPGMTSLPFLHERQAGYQRAFLKIQDGCDAHCTYCIIPELRPTLWSKPVEECVQEANQLVAAGHKEIVLTGIFLGAYGHETALRRRQGGEEDKGTRGQGDKKHSALSTQDSALACQSAIRNPQSAIAHLLESLCTQVPGLHRLRLSSLEPGDLTDDLLRTLASFPQIVPHFHLPLQSGSTSMLRRMNRQYTRDDYLRMIDRVRSTFDRPALTTDIIVGFPGESDDEFDRTLQVVDSAQFIHIHTFSFSPRPGTAAARWTKDFVRGPVVNQRIERLNELAAKHSLGFRSTFVGQTVEILVEHESAEEQDLKPLAGYQHGRCERYFPVHFEPGKREARSAEREEGDERHDPVQPGTAVRVRIDRVTPTHTFGTLVE